MGNNLFLGEPVELDDLNLLPKSQRHDLHHFIGTVQLDNHPTAMYVGLTAPIQVRHEVRAKLLDRPKRFDSGFVLFLMA